MLYFKSTLRYLFGATILISTCAYGNVLQETTKPENINQIISRYFIDHPEDLQKALNSLAVFQKTEKEKRFQENFKILETKIHNLPVPYLGNKNASKSIIVFSDYACAYCKAMSGKILQFIAQNPDFKILFFEYPILGKNSEELARLSIAAFSIGKFEEYYRNIMNFKDTKSLTPEIAASLIKTKLQTLTSSQEYKNSLAAIAENKSIAHQLSINSTPTAIYNGKIIQGDWTSAIAGAAN